ncbi:UNVERIFIED_CONTAM: Retrovirus-related Pol polyprotein from transposon TNT 1-94 [Sesamum latifolium]|uniref:Retrovirus-related Pol polyprotein from transposon TNT 1-94 n=1 Tax=Sesamum latifolium TaxID=2727402 RepID=A0AAW2XR27_9LAMI
MKGILIQQKVFKAISGKYPDNASEEKIVEDDEIAYSSIILNLSDFVIRKVGSQNSAIELWEKLEEIYTETSLPTKLFLLKIFFKYKLDLSKNIDDNIDEFTKLIQDIKLTGDKSIDEYSSIVLLNAIPDTYNDVKSAMKYGRDSVNLETVINGFKSKEIDLKTNKPSQSNNEVNMVRGRTKNRNSDYKFRRHSKSRSRSRGRSNSRPKYKNRDDKNRDDKHREDRNKDDKRCYNCGGRGHFIKECKKPKKKNQNDSANVVEENTDEVYMICDVNAVNSSVNMNEWLIDSGCTFHMTPFREILTNYKSENLGSVSMANEKLCDVHGYGDVCLNFKNDFKFTLKNIRHVPDLCHNLMSCAALEEDGLEGRWGKGIMKIMKGSLTVFKAEKRRNLYFCYAKYDLLAASAVHSKISDLWHKRLGHMSSKGLDLLHKQGMLKEKCDNISFCDDCILGKHHKVQFPSSSSQKPSSSSCILDYIHADVWGPANVPTHGGNRYFLSIIDNYSRKGDALMTAAYLINRSPSVPLLGKVPECVWTGSDVDLSSLCIFGCSAFALQNGDKLDPRAQKCVFIGYPNGVQGYRLWVRNQPGLKIITSRDVTFNELEMPCLTDTSRKETDFNIENTFNKVDLNPQDNQQGEEAKNEENQPRNRVEENTENSENHNNDYQLARDRYDSDMPIFLVLYVDDMLIASPSLTLIAELQNNLGKNFEMKDLGNAKKILGMTIERNRKNSSIFLNQSSYVKNVLKRFSMQNAKPTSVPLAAHFQLCKDQSPKTDSEKEKMKNVPYSNAIGSVMYLMVSTRPDIALCGCLCGSVRLALVARLGGSVLEALAFEIQCLCGLIRSLATVILGCGPTSLCGSLGSANPEQGNLL